MPFLTEKLVTSGFSDREIVKISGHKNIATVSHYNPGQSIQKKLSMAQATGMAGSKRALPIGVPSGSNMRPPSPPPSPPQVPVDQDWEEEVLILDEENKENEVVASKKIRIEEKTVVFPAASQLRQIQVTDENLLAFLNEQAIQLNRQQNLFAYIAKKQQ